MTKKPTRLAPYKRIALYTVLLLSVCLLAFSASRYLQKQAEEKNSGRRRLAFAPAVEKDNEALLAFKKEFPDREIYLACQEDVTDDGISDLLVIYKEGSLVRFVTAMGQDGGGYVYTDPIPAPIENQGIQFKNIDHEGEMEFIISGEKNGQAGYAIYRIIDGQPKDLFGDGMDNFCLKEHPYEYNQKSLTVYGSHPYSLFSRDIPFSKG